MTDEDLILARIRAYMDDLVAFERYAYGLQEQRDRLGQPFRSDPDVDRLFFAYQSRHRIEQAAGTIDGARFGSPTRADWTRTAVVSVAVDGERAVVETRERSTNPPDWDTYRYVLEKENGEWRLADRLLYFEYRDPDDPDAPEWIDGLL